MRNQAGRIIVGYDATPSSCRALDWAAAEAQRRELPLTVIHVGNHLAAIARAGHTTRWPEVFEHEDHGLVEQGARRARKTATSIEITTENAGARVSDTLIAASRQARLLVLGNTRHRISNGAAIHSVALTVSGGAHCPCVVVRGDSSSLAGPQHPVAVGTDDAPDSHAALLHAAAVAHESKATLRVIAAYRSTNRRPIADHAVERAVGDVLARFPDLKISGLVHVGSVTSVLSDNSCGAGLLVLGRRRCLGPARPRIGSVLDGLLRSAPCPVLVVQDVR
jgi:nucleotide-binding universal stress UspA family protein